MQGNCEYEPAIKIVKKGTGKPGAHRYADGAECPGAHRSKLAHLENSAFKVRELIDGAVVRLVWCPTDENAADIFTKSLGTRKFKKFQAFLLGLPQDGEFKALICRMLFM